MFLKVPLETQATRHTGYMIQVCVCMYLLCHGGGEQHGLSVVGTQPDDLLHLFLKVLVQHPERETHRDTKYNKTGESVSPTVFIGRL